MFDRSTALIGSANLDPRSLVLNTESGIVVESPELAVQKIVRRFEQFPAGANSYVVTSDGSTLQWRTNVDGQEVRVVRRAWDHTRPAPEDRHDVDPADRTPALIGTGR